MANKSFVIQYVIKARDSFSAAAKTSAASSKKIAASIDVARKSMRKMQRQAKKTSSSTISSLKGMAAAYLGLQGAMSFLSIGGGFQDAVANLSAITGSTGADLDKLNKKILEMAIASSTAQVEVANAITLVASSKPDLLSNIDALTKTTEQVLLLKNAGVDLNTAATAVAEGLNIFGEGAEFAARNVNILAAGSKLGSSLIGETADAVMIAGPGAKAAGLSFLQLNAAIQTVAKGGIKGSQAGTALGAIFGRLRRQGIDFQKIGLQASFELVKKKLDGVTDSTARALMEAKIFGEEHAKVGLGLLNNSSFLGMYEKSLDGTNVAQEQANVRLATFNAKMRLVSILIKDSLIKTFLKLEPQLKKLAEEFANFISGISAEDIDTFAEAIGVLVSAMKLLAFFAKEALGLLKGVGLLTKAIFTGDFSNLQNAFRIGSPDLPSMSSGPSELSKQSMSVDVGVNVGMSKGLEETDRTVTYGGRSGRVPIGRSGYAFAREQ